MESCEIKDSQILASSEWDNKHRAQNGRLNFQKSNYRHAWSAGGNDNNPWLQVDIENLAVIIEVLTQGRSDFPQWVKTFTLSYHNESDQFQLYAINGVQKVLEWLRQLNTRYCSPIAGAQ